MCTSTVLCSQLFLTYPLPHPLLPFEFGNNTPVLRGRQIHFWTGVGYGLGLRTAPGQSRTQIFSMSQKTLPYQLGSQMCQQFSDVCGCQRGGTVGPNVHPLDGAPVIWFRMSGHPYVCRQDVGVWGCDLGVCFRGVRG